ncbi:MAG: SDR family NAD(P)-dependent oxidoreductase [Halobacteriota archaeon]
MRLEGKTAVVTGGASGIGRGIAIEFATEGADVAVGDVRRDSANDDSTTPTVERVREQGREAVFVETDVADADDARRLVETAAETFGGVDIVVNNAGVARGGSVDDVTDEEWDRTFAVNVTGIRNVTKWATPYLAESDAGRVVNMASQLGLVGRRESAAYCASKGAIVNLTRQMAMDYADDDVTVNAIAPGIVQVRSEMNEERRERLDAYALLSGPGTPQDVGRAAVFLASDDGRYVTGHTLVVDGGYTVH